MDRLTDHRDELCDLRTPLGGPVAHVRGDAARRLEAGLGNRLDELGRDVGGQRLAAALERCHHFSDVAGVAGRDDVGQRRERFFQRPAEDVGVRRFVRTRSVFANV
jgi:hypothetical protein